MKIPTEWLTERVEDAPASFGRTIAPSAALRGRMAWQKLKRETIEGDELWAFSSPPSSSWKQTRYVGYALVREGKILQTAVITPS